jgi:ribosomal protein S18 acetylase RimI-like enzyme
MFLSSLYVEPEFRDEGIGIALLKRVAAIASERGYHEAEWNVRSWNDSAISFFRAAGAEFPKGSPRFLMDEDALYCLARRGTEPTDDARPKHQAGGDEFSLKQGGRDENGHEQIRRTA